MTVKLKVPHDYEIQNCLVVWFNFIYFFTHKENKNQALVWTPPPSFVDNLLVWLQFQLKAFGVRLHQLYTEHLKQLKLFQTVSEELVSNLTADF